MSIQVIDNEPGVNDPANMFEPFISAKKMALAWRSPAQSSRLMRTVVGRK